MQDHLLLASDHQQGQRPDTRYQISQAKLMAAAHKGTR